MTKTINSKTVISYALLTPPYLIAFASTVIICHHADKTKERTWHMICGLAVAMTGLIILGASTNTGARYFAMIIMTSGIYVPYDTK